MASIKTARYQGSTYVRSVDLADLIEEGMDEGVNATKLLIALKKWLRAVDKNESSQLAL